MPERHTDFAFSVFAEEWGLTGCLFLLALYCLIVLWGLHIALRANDRFGMYLAIGVSAMLFWHIVLRRYEHDHNHDRGRHPHERQHAPVYVLGAATPDPARDPLKVKSLKVMTTLLEVPLDSRLLYLYTGPRPPIHLL